MSGASCIGNIARVTRARTSVPPRLDEKDLGVIIDTSATSSGTKYKIACFKPGAQTSARLVSRALQHSVEGQPLPLEATEALDGAFVTHDFMKSAIVTFIGKEQWRPFLGIGELPPTEGGGRRVAAQGRRRRCEALAKPHSRLQRGARGPSTGPRVPRGWGHGAGPGGARGEEREK